MSSFQAHSLIGTTFIRESHRDPFLAQYINDIVNDIGSNIRLFADEKSLFLVVENPDTVAETLNSDLEKITQLANTWLVKFNPAKTESLLISRKVIKPIHTPLYMQNHEI